MLSELRRWIAGQLGIPALAAAVAAVTARQSLLLAALARDSQRLDRLEATPQASPDPQAGQSWVIDSAEQAQMEAQASQQSRQRTLARRFSAPSGPA